MENPSENVKELEHLIEMGDPHTCMVEEEEVVPFRNDIKEVAHGFTFLEFPMSNPKTKDVYRNELKTHIHINAFTSHYDREPSDNDVSGG